MPEQFVMHTRVLVTDEAPDICLVYADEDYAALEAGTASPVFLDDDEGALVSHTPAALIHIVAESWLTPA